MTDGRTWSFYLPGEQGSYEDQRVYKLDLFERPPTEAAQALSAYLGRPRVESGVALEMARQQYRTRSRRSQAYAAIPEAWHELAEKGDESLVELLASAVESKAGVRPDLRQGCDWSVLTSDELPTLAGGARSAGGGRCDHEAMPLEPGR